MGQGFPQIPTRDSFGPKYVNAANPKFPEQELIAADVELASWQAALLSKTSPSVIVIAEANAPWAITSIARTHDPKGILSDPAVVAISDTREIDFNVQYENEAGELRQFLPFAAQVFPYFADTTDQGAAAHIEMSAYVRGSRVGVRFFDAGVQIAPESCLIQVWGGST